MTSAVAAVRRHLVLDTSVAEREPDFSERWIQRLAERYVVVVPTCVVMELLAVKGRDGVDREKLERMRRWMKTPGIRIAPVPAQLIRAELDGRSVSLESELDAELAGNIAAGSVVIEDRQLRQWRDNTELGVEMLQELIGSVPALGAARPDPKNAEQFQAYLGLVLEEAKPRLQERWDRTRVKHAQAGKDIGPMTKLYLLTGVLSAARWARKDKHQFNEAVDINIRSLAVMAGGFLSRDEPGQKVFRMLVDADDSALVTGDEDFLRNT